MHASSMIPSETYGSNKVTPIFRWMTDLINNIVNEDCIPDDWRRVPWILLLEQLMKVLQSVEKEDQILCDIFRR